MAQQSERQRRHGSITMSHIKPLIKSSCNELCTLHKNIYQRDLVTISDYTALCGIEKNLINVYEHLDIISIKQNTNVVNETMEYAEMMRKRIAAIAEYIRPYRLKHENVQVSTVLSLINTEQQALHHLIALNNGVKP